MNISAVAHKAGVSTATVSRVLNSSAKVRESTAVAVRRAIADLNYMPNSNARTLRSGRSNLYGILVSDIRNPFFPDVIEHFESLAHENGIDVTIANTGYSADRLVTGIRRLLERGIDGIAVLTSEVSQPAIKLLRASRVPTVFLNQPVVMGDFCNITVDYLRGFVQAIDHLHMLGHRKIGFVAGPPTLSSANRRRKAFFAAIKNSGLTLRDNWIIEGDHRLAGGRFAAEKVFSMAQPPTAIVCSNDMMAIGFLQAAIQNKRQIPEEFSLIGFDDLFLCEAVTPSLTTLHLSRSEIAARSFYSLHAESQAKLEPVVKPKTSVILPRLVVRDSTGRAAK